MKTLLLTRPSQASQEDRQHFEEMGFIVEEFPMIQLEACQLDASFDLALKEANWLFISSQFAVDFLVESTKKRGLFQELASKRLASIGDVTSQAVIQQGLTVDFQASHPKKTCLVQEWHEQQYQEGDQILYPTSNLSDDYAIDYFQNQKIPFQQLAIYRNQPHKSNQERLDNWLETHCFQAAYFSSPSSWHRFYQVFAKHEDRHLGVKWLAIGKTTAQAIQEDGFQAILKRDYLVEEEGRGDFDRDVEPL